MHHDAPDIRIDDSAVGGIPRDARIQAYLASLPAPTLPAALWPRVHAERARRRATRRRHVAIAIAAALVLAVLPLRLLRHEAVTAPTGTAGVDAATPLLPDPATAALQAQIRALDRELQAGYARGADEAELAPLWQARRAALKAPRRDEQISPLRI